ncbi:MAG: TetR/AcrR family transcriptional regulator [Chloroflexia bacterium]
MGVKERRQREKQELRTGILTAAREIAQEEGWGAVTIRKVADLIEYSPPTIYEYFDSKDDLLQQLSMEGFRGMYSMMQSAYNSTSEPEDRLMSVSLAHWDFAWIHPDLYQVMHGLEGASCNPTAIPTEVEQVFLIVRDSAMLALKTDVDDPGLYDAIDVLRCGIHGLISQAFQHRIMGGQQRGRELVKRAVHDAIVAWPTHPRP